MQFFLGGLFVALIGTFLVLLFKSPTDQQPVFTLKVKRRDLYLGINLIAVMAVLAVTIVTMK